MSGTALPELQGGVMRRANGILYWLATNPPVKVHNVPEARDSRRYDAIESSTRSMRLTTRSATESCPSPPTDSLFQQWRKNNHRRIIFSLVWFALFVVLVCGAILSPASALALRGSY